MLEVFKRMHSFEKYCDDLRDETDKVILWDFFHILIDCKNFFSQLDRMTK